ncbi:MAG TPA: ATP-binding protein [Actinomycetota bacterium]|nr:ATP-binding protein [Actinomycetota bacterium]
MFQSFMAVPLHFTVEFLGFLLTSGGALLVLSKPQLVPGGRWNRVLVAMGFTALATVQVLHGGSFLASDDATLLVTLRTAGYLMLGIGLLGPTSMRRPAAPAGVASVTAISASLGAAFLTLVSVLAAIRSGNRSLFRLAGAAALLSVAEGLAVRGDSGAFGAGVPDAYSYTSHGIKLLAFLLMSTWLWVGVRSSIRARFVASFVALLVVVVLALSTALTGVISNSVEEAELGRVKDQAENIVQSIEETESRELLAQVRLLAQSPAFQRELAGRDIESTADDIIETELLDISFVLLRKNNGLVEVSGRGAAVNSAAGIETRAIKQADIVQLLGSDIFTEALGPAREAVGLERIRESVVLLVVSDVGDLGTIVVGRYIDALETEEISNALAPAKASIVVGERVTATEIPGAEDADLVPRAVANELESQSGAVVRQQQIGGASYYSAFAALKRGDGFTVGYFALSSPARIVARTRSGVTRTLFLVAMGVGAISLGLAWLSGRVITRPIQQLTRTAIKVREGDLQAQAPVGGDDEVGQLGETFNEMTASLFTMTNDLREAASEEYRLRARIETIIQSMADGLVAVDPEGRILAFNRSAELLTGMKSKTVMGRHAEEILDVRDTQGEVVPLPIFSLASGSVGGVMLTRKNGKTVPVAITAAVLRGEGDDVAGGVAVIRDMTREREVERMKSEFLSNISHELRTPLTPIKGYAEILNKKDLPPEKTKQFVKGILESTDRLERIVELLVDFSAMEAGRLSPRVSTIDVASMLGELAGEWEKRTPRHRVVADVKSRLPRVVGDERLLRRSIEEVIDNAVKFSPDGGTITLEARASTSTTNGRRKVVAVTVADEGIGITPADLDEIFSDFHQLDGSETRSYGGLGLGLAFVRRIVEAHEGTIDVESELDQGTRLTIALPALVKPKASPKASAKATKAPAKAPARAKRG